MKISYTEGKEFAVKVDFAEGSRYGEWERPGGMCDADWLRLLVIAGATVRVNGDLMTEAALEALAEQAQADAAEARPAPLVFPIPHKCPVCDGTGRVSRPPYVAGDVQSWSGTSLNHPCQPCKATGLLWSLPVTADAAEVTP